MLRRRTGKDEDPASDSSRTSRPRFNRIKTEEDKLREEFGGAKVKQLVIRPRSKRRNGFIFVLGGLFGIFIALFFANQQEVISFESLMDLNLDSLIDAIPQGIISDAKQFMVWLLVLSYPSSCAVLTNRYLTATGPRHCHLRFLLCRTSPTVTGRHGQAPRRYDSWSHLYRTRELGNGYQFAAVLPETTMGQLEHDAGPSDG